MRIVRTILVLLLVLVGCSHESRDQLLVSAASSLTDAFGAIEEEYEAAHSDVDVVLNLAGSSTLREQILEGAPADVFASANLENMDQVVAAGEAVGSPEIFAHNVLQIAVPAGNPAGVNGLEDLSDESLFIGLCAEGVPCGDFAREALRNAGVDPSIDTNEPDVRSLLTKVQAGELDAGITYVTDVAATAGAAEGVEILETVNVVARYPIAVLAGASSRESADAFIEFVLSDRGQMQLAEFGFSSP